MIWFHAIILSHTIQDSSHLNLPKWLMTSPSPCRPGQLYLDHDASDAHGQPGPRAFRHKCPPGVDQTSIIWYIYIYATVSSKMHLLELGQNLVQQCALKTGDNPVPEAPLGLAPCDRPCLAPWDFEGLSSPQAPERCFFSTMSDVL